ncbi:MAG: MATE family efflux transporter [Desulfurococcales archaeon]|nr:MATE family efflux transporter [Desulfurococcales archaeon]
MDKEVWRKALVIALPLMLAESADSILWIVDTYFISRLGDEALAAAGVGGYLGWLTFSIGTLYYTGALVLVSQAVGASKKSTAEQSVGEILTANIILAIPVLILLWKTAPYLVDIIAGEKVGLTAKSLAIDYYRARLYGMPFAYMGLVFGAVYRGVGRTRPVLYSTIIFTIVNGVLDPILIFGLYSFPPLGISGAGYASSIANIVYAIGLYMYLPGHAGMKPVPRPPRHLAWKATKIGFPTLIERLVFVGGNLAYIGAVARCGEDALAAHTIGVRIESLAFLPLFSIAESGAALVGQAIGAGDPKKAKHMGVEVAKLNLVAGAISMVVILLLSNRLPYVFTESSDVARLAMYYLIIAGVTEPPLGVVMSIAMSIRGAGNTTIPTIINLSALYLLRIIPAGILPRFMPEGLCAVGAWLAMGIDVTGRSLILLWVYKRYFDKLARKLV